MTTGLETARIYIQALDLNYIVEAMCAPSYPLPRWIKADAETCCQLYKNFLILNRKYTTEVFVPSREIDEFWHNHILYTKQYTQDCQVIFGHYLHHNPASPNEDLSHLAAGFLRTKQLYLIEFGEPLTLIGKTIQ